MSTENSMQTCSNCIKEFPVDKIDLHEAYCCRNIRRCQQCEAMIDIKDMDEHIVYNVFNSEITALQKALPSLSGSVLAC